MIPAWCVVPLSRPGQLGNTLHNFWRQRNTGKRLCIVENGPAIGVCARHGVEPAMLLRSEPGVSRALNVALAELLRRSEHASWFVRFDDDDYYSSGYLDEIVGSPPWADFVGKPAIYVKTPGDRLVRYDYPIHNGAPAGGTIAARVAQCHEWDESRECGEDIEWAREAYRRGMRPWFPGPRGYCQRRWAWPHRHTWPMTEELRRRLHRIPIWDFGNYNERVVDEESPIPVALLKPSEPMTISEMRALV